MTIPGLRTFAPILAVAATLSTGCATIAARGPDPIRITSVPNGAVVRVDGRPVGSTPVTPKVDRDAEVLTFEKANYEDAVRPVPRRLNNWVFGNILIGGLIGLIIDIATGNAEVAEESLHVELRPASEGSLR